MDISSIENLPHRLSERLAHRLPGRQAQSQFAPELCYGRHTGPPSIDARQAAVVVLFYRQQGEWRIPLTLRPEHLPDHAGQICFPGGLTEPNEISEQSALRELNEELNVHDDQVTILGTISPIYVFASNFWVTPFVAFAEKSVQFCPNPDEVAEIVELPLATLVDRTSWGTRRIERRGISFDARHIACGRHEIWGATSMVLGELIAILDELIAP